MSHYNFIISPTTRQVPTVMTSFINSSSLALLLSFGIALMSSGISPRRRPFAIPNKNFEIKIWDIWYQEVIFIIFLSNCWIWHQNHLGIITWSLSQPKHTLIRLTLFFLLMASSVKTCETKALEIKQRNSRRWKKKRMKNYLISASGGNGSVPQRLNSIKWFYLPHIKSNLNQSFFLSIFL